MSTAASLSAQSSSTNIPIRSLGPVTAVSSDTLGPRVAVRALSNGTVLVNDIVRQRVRLYDATLATSRVVIDSGAGGGNASMPVSVPSAQLIPFPGDSTLYVDVASAALLVLDPQGKVAHVMALPRPRDAMFLAIGGMYGSPAVDGQGRLVYRGVVITPPRAPTGNAAGATATMGGMMGFRLPQQPDSSPIVRADFDTRKVDTLTMIKALNPTSKMAISQDKTGNFVLTLTLNPLDAGDEWAVLSDGTIAIVRAHDYHVDFVGADGSIRSAPKMPFDWMRLTEEQKQFKIDSLRPELEKQMMLQGVNLPSIPTPNGVRKISLAFDFVPLKEIPDYEPPVSPGSVKADLNNNLWIVARTAIGGGSAGLRYDVVNSQGVLVERVQFPKGKVLAGFGAGGAVYLLNTDGKTAVLERASLK
ncbi:MAG: hypothetical protein IT353_16930 [Gemmatimonadaceae bacterium]|nr:hypothetical protein [Gemmatimonadaceae bacterium]